MKNEKLFEAIGNVDNDLLENAQNTKKTAGKASWLKRGGIAACLCLVLAIPLMVNGNFLKGNPTDTGAYVASGKVIDQFTPDMNGIYEAPKNGSVVYVNEVKNAIEKYKGQDVKFFVGIDLYANQAPLDNESDSVKEEVNRLKKQGYQVGYAKNWQYEGENQQVNHTYVAGYFTAEELKNFKASEGLGYTLKFVTNGDGTAVSAEKGIVNK